MKTKALQPRRNICEGQRTERGSSAPPPPITTSLQPVYETSVNVGDAKIWNEKSLNGFLYA